MVQLSEKKFLNFIWVNICHISDGIVTKIKNKNLRSGRNLKTGFWSDRKLLNVRDRQFVYRATLLNILRMEVVSVWHKMTTRIVFFEKEGKCAIIWLRHKRAKSSSAQKLSKKLTLDYLLRNLNMGCNTIPKWEI